MESNSSSARSPTFFAHPVVVLALCISIEEVLPMILDELDMLPPSWRHPVSVGIAIFGAVLRAVKFAATYAQAKEAKQAAILASATPPAVTEAPGAVMRQSPKDGGT